MLDRLGTDGGVRALLVLASNIVGLRPGREPGARPARAPWTCWWSPTSSCPRPPSSPTSCCPTAQWAEEEGTMTNLEGRVIRRRRALPPPDGVLDDLQMLKRAGRPAGPRPVLLRRPARGVRRAAPGQRRRHRRLRRHHLRADRRRAGRLLAVPDARTTRARRGCSPTASRPPDGRARFIRVEHRDAGRDARRRLPVRADHRPADGAVPERHPDPPGAGARRRPRCSPRPQLHPDLARRLRHRRRPTSSS